jgi:hypothetical protein|tara:strand:- start:2 stop:154 length:153 start_codon:yes stop_codon:yes gene_type:complete
MIKLILDMLEIANAETENIRIAQGKNKIPENLKEGIKQFKNEMKWRRKRK